MVLKERWGLDFFFFPAEVTKFCCFTSVSGPGFGAEIPFWLTSSAPPKCLMSAGSKETNRICQLHTSHVVYQ